MPISETDAIGKVGLRQVAESAGTSVATASAILGATRSSTRFSLDTRDRVLRVAQEMQYHPNAHARGLHGYKTKTLGILFGLERASVAVGDPYIVAVLQGIVAAAAQAGHNVTLFTEPWRSATVSAGVLRDGRTDGVLVIAPVVHSDLISSLVSHKIPAVSLALAAKNTLIPAVDVDNVAGARLAVGHLLHLGHTRIAHLAGDENLYSTHQRRETFEQTLSEAGVPVRPDYRLPGSYAAQSGRERTLHLLGLPIPPTAIFAASDFVAQGVLQAAREHNIVVPDQLSVVGFDNLAHGAATPEPFLTTIHQPLVQIGEEATRLLLRQIQGDPVPPIAALFAPTLMVRASTAAAPPQKTG